jgi:hypothetical protein
MTSTLAPSARREDDLPHVPGDQPLWSENFFFSGYDPDQRIGFFVHVGTFATDPSLWHGLIAVYLPDGDVLVCKEHGRADGPRRAGPPSLRLTCLEPLKRWAVTFDGVARRIPSTVPLNGMVPDGISIPVQVNLVYTGHSEAWDMNADALKHQEWGDVHLEQNCHFAGSVSIEGTELEVRGPGFRDHTSGPRDVSPYRESTWVHAVFPSGLAFMGLEVWGGPDSAQYFRLGWVVRDGKTLEAQPQDLPRPFGIQPGLGPLPFRFETEDGPIDFEVEVLASTGFTVKAPQEWCHGVELESSQDELLSIECPARYRCGDEVGHGHFERMLRVSAYEPPNGRRG